MKKTTGRLSSLSLSYDFVFFVLVRSVTDRDRPRIGRHRCPMHPLRRRPMAEPSPTLTLAARLSASLTYHQLRDDLTDKGLWRRIRAALLYPAFAYARRRAALSEVEGEFRRCLDTLRRLERERSDSVDLAADAFGQMLAAAFTLGLTGANKRICHEIGLHLGRFIYAADAAEDYESDRESGNYNPYVVRYGGDPLDGGIRETMRTALYLELSALEKAIDLLPFDDYAAERSILRNILYLGLPYRIRFLGTSEQLPFADLSNDERKTGV